MYVILGATGNTGSVVAENLLAKRQKVRAVGRNKERLAALAKRGAETLEGDISDSNFLTRAFDGAQAVYFLAPPLPTSNDYAAYQDLVVDAGTSALQTARVRHVVTLSSVGADRESGTGPVAGLHRMESKFSHISGLNALHLRAGYFMENTLPQVGVIQNFGMVAGPMRPDLALPMIATKDIGDAAAQALLTLDFSGQHTRELLGQRDVTYTDVAHIIGAAIRKPNLPYRQLPADQFIQALTQMGMTRNFAELLIEMTTALNEGSMKALEPRSAANSTPTSYEQFVQGVFVPAYKGKAASA